MFQNTEKPEKRAGFIMRHEIGSSPQSGCGGCRSGAVFRTLMAITSPANLVESANAANKGTSQR